MSLPSPRAMKASRSVPKEKQRPTRKSIVPRRWTILRAQIALCSTPRQRLITTSAPLTDEWTTPKSSLKTKPPFADSCWKPSASLPNWKPTRTPASYLPILATLKSIRAKCCSRRDTQQKNINNHPSKRLFCNPIEPYARVWFVRTRPKRLFAVPYKVRFLLALPLSWNREERKICSSTHCLLRKKNGSRYPDLLAFACHFLSFWRAKTKKMTCKS